MPAFGGLFGGGGGGSSLGAPGDGQGGKPKFIATMALLDTTIPANIPAPPKCFTAKLKMQISMIPGVLPGVMEGTIYYNGPENSVRIDLGPDFYIVERYDQHCKVTVKGEAEPSVEVIPAEDKMPSFIVPEGTLTKYRGVQTVAGVESFVYNFGFSLGGAMKSNETIWVAVESPHFPVYHLGEVQAGPMAVITHQHLYDHVEGCDFQDDLFDAPLIEELCATVQMNARLKQAGVTEGLNGSTFALMWDNTDTPVNLDLQVSHYLMQNYCYTSWSQRRRVSKQCRMQETHCLASARQNGRWMYGCGGKMFVQDGCTTYACTTYDDDLVKEPVESYKQLKRMTGKYKVKVAFRSQAAAKTRKQDFTVAITLKGKTTEIITGSVGEAEMVLVKEFPYGTTF